MVQQLWTQPYDKFKPDNTSNLPHILHAFFCEVCDTDQPPTFKRDTHERNLQAMNKDFHSFPLIIL